ncbi:MAG: flagellar protein FlaG [Desulfobacterales bacterium]|jgi:flagellar protein FlaG|nr:flagellar protein FlaG [Desulfobacterales bacterium]
MFETITQTASKVQNGGELPPPHVVPVKAAATAEMPSTNSSAKLPPEQAIPVEAEEKASKVTQKMLAALEQDIESIHNIRIQFSMHDKTGRTMIKIMDKTTEKLIREIPSEEVLNLAAKIEEMIGILFDKKV